MQDGKTGKSKEEKGREWRRRKMKRRIKVRDREGRKSG